MAPPRVGVSILKSTSFRLATQQFSNTYYYQRPAGIGALSDLNAIIDELVAYEKTIHGSQVKFETARLWSAGGSVAENEMLIERALSGFGTMGGAGGMDRERAILISWPAGKNTRGKPVYLRKWYHVCGWPLGFTIPQAVLENTAEIPADVRTWFKDKASTIDQVGPSIDVYGLVAKSGRGYEGQPVCHRFLEHHQLGDAWR